MRVLFHPEFPKDIRRFEAEYARISDGLAERFREEIDAAVDAIELSPGSAGHFLNPGSSIVPELRRRNLRSGWSSRAVTLRGLPVISLTVKANIR